MDNQDPILKLARQKALKEKMRRGERLSQAEREEAPMMVTSPSGEFKRFVDKPRSTPPPPTPNENTMDSEQDKNAQYNKADEMAKALGEMKQNNQESTDKQSNQMMQEEDPEIKKQDEAKAEAYLSHLNRFRNADDEAEEYLNDVLEQGELGEHGKQKIIQQLGYDPRDTMKKARFQRMQKFINSNGSVGEE